MEHVLHHDDGSQFLAVGMLVDYLLLACVAHAGRAHADAELALAVGALEHELLSWLVLCFVEGYVLVTLGATYFFHVDRCFFLVGNVGSVSGAG